MKKDKQRSIQLLFKFLTALCLFVSMFIVSIVFGAADTTMKDVWLSTYI